MQDKDKAAESSGKKDGIRKRTLLKTVEDSVGDLKRLEGGIKESLLLKRKFFFFGKGNEWKFGNEQLANRSDATRFPYLVAPAELVPTGASKVSYQPPNADPTSQERDGI